METGNNDGLDTTLEKIGIKCSWLTVVTNIVLLNMSKMYIYINTLKEQKRLKIDVRNVLI